MVLSSSVVTPAFTCGPIISSTFAAKRPATRIFSISSAVLIFAAMTTLHFIEAEIYKKASVPEFASIRIWLVFIERLWYKTRRLNRKFHSCRANLKLTHIYRHIMRGALNGSQNGVYGGLTP